MCCDKISTSNNLSESIFFNCRNHQIKYFLYKSNRHSHPFRRRCQTNRLTRSKDRCPKGHSLRHPARIFPARFFRRFCNKKGQQKIRKNAASREYIHNPTFSSQVFRFRPNFLPRLIFPASFFCEFISPFPLWLLDVLQPASPFYLIPLVTAATVVVRRFFLPPNFLLLLLLEMPLLGWRSRHVEASYFASVFEISGFFLRIQVPLAFFHTSTVSQFRKEGGES